MFWVSLLGFFESLFWYNGSWKLKLVISSFISSTIRVCSSWKLEVNKVLILSSLHLRWFVDSILDLLQGPINRFYLRNGRDGLSALWLSKFWLEFGWVLRYEVSFICRWVICLMGGVLSWKCFVVSWRKERYYLNRSISIPCWVLHNLLSQG